MIAKVRIAPVERWCEETTPHHDDGEVGLEVEIETMSMREKRNCPGKSWLLTEKSTELLQRLTHIKYSKPRIWICEHMLEMD